MDSSRLPRRILFVFCNSGTRKVGGQIKSYGNSIKSYLLKMPCLRSIYANDLRYNWEVLSEKIHRDNFKKALKTLSVISI